jgi:tetratricopeptide (TPR) repeat protein/tRNA A-37 threonylcarbamoyl transferase component Bud32
VAATPTFDDLTTRLHSVPGDSTATAGAAPPPSGETGPLQAGQSFGPRYHIIRALGVGGMGAVYQAWDAELAETVAIKVIRPEVMANPEAAWDVEKRFKRELLLARQVTHKNVVRIHDLGEIDGIKYITMSYVEGTDLATLLKQEGALGVERALSITRSIVAGLQAAHVAGVVHRDLKPGNIMIRSADVEALIMDFGIARSTSAPATLPALTVRALPADLRDSATRYTEATMAGSIVGTIQYMAPEQARGEEVDQRADIYAVGLILYDMLAGPHRSLHAESAFAELRSRMTQAPQAVQSIVPQVPDAVNRIVSRCLEPAAASRYQTTVELAAELDQLDARGVPLPRIRRLTPRLAAAAALLVAAMLGGTYVLTRRAVAPAVQPDPVAVVIADFDNRTRDPAFDRTLEPMLRRALEGAGFISAYDRNGIGRTLGVRPPDVLDEAAAREIALKQGLGVVLSGAIGPAGNGYEVSVRAIETVTGNVIANAQRRAAGKDQVLEAATNLMATVRNALGDDESESAQMFAMASLSATSLDVIGQYAAAQEASSSGRFEEARQRAMKAVALDPTFGTGYQLIAIASRNLGNTQDAVKYVNEALRYLDGMTERERYSTRGFYYRLTGDYQQCVKEYGELVSRYAADVVGRNQRALCLSQLRDMRGAMQEMQLVVDLLPNRVLFRDNLALYANYAGDFVKAEQEARAVGEPDAYATLALAFAQLGQGQVAEEAGTYQTLAALGALGASLSASGLADLAAFEGRYADAARGLLQGIATDVKAGSRDRAAAKLAALAHVRLLQGQPGQAIAAAEQALEYSQAVKIRFLAARAFVEAGAANRARALVDGLGSELQAEPRAYGKILAAEITLRDGDARGAIQLLTEANGLLDTWVGHFDLGRAYLEASAFAQADSEFDRCIRRRGEALSLFLDEEPSYAYLPAVYYYQGRVREGLKTGFAEPYKAYLGIRGRSTEDRLLPEIRRRVGG